MNECVIYNKYALLNLKVKYKFIIIFSILLFLIIIFSFIFYKAYDSFKVSGIYLNNEINVTVLESDVKKLLDSKYLEVNGVKYKFSILSVSRLEQEVITNSY